MESLINQLVDSIKQDKRYKDVVLKEKLLEDKNVQAILKQYQIALLNYQEANSYQKADAKQKLQECKLEMASYDAIQEYYNAYYQLQDFLEEINGIIFSDISDELTLSKYEL